MAITFGSRMTIGPTLVSSVTLPTMMSAKNPDVAALVDLDTQKDSADTSIFERKNRQGKNREKRAVKRKNSDQDLPTPPKKRRKNNKKPNKGATKRKEHSYPVEPRLVQVVKKPYKYTNHTYSDFSGVPPEIGDNVLLPTKLEDMTFWQKIHHMLGQDQYTLYISWLGHGRAFKVHFPKYLEQKNILKKYFGHSRFSTFLRQLNDYGFKHVTQGIDRNSYYHECMLRGLPHLCKYMPAPKDSRPLAADPENEPDFYAISRKYPLPDDPVCYKLTQDLTEVSAAAPALVSPAASEHAPDSSAFWLEQQMVPASNPVDSLSRFCLSSMITPLAPPPSFNNCNDTATTAFLRAEATAKGRGSQPFATTNEAPGTAAALLALLNSDRSSATFPGLF